MILIIIINTILNKVKLDKYKHELRNKQNNVKNTILLPLKATTKKFSTLLWLDSKQCNYMHKR